MSTVEGYPWTPSPNFHAGRRRPVRVIVIHTTESPETSGMALAVANYFARPTTQASSHLVVDNAATIRCVRDEDTAWAAPGANADGLQIEHAGYAGQSAAQWIDGYSIAELNVSAHAVARWCSQFNIPAVHLTDAQLAAGAKGIVGHYQVSAVYAQSTHTDPGPNFPWARYIAQVRALLTGPTPNPPPTPPQKRYAMLVYAEGDDQLSAQPFLRSAVVSSSLAEAQAALARGDDLLVIGGPAVTALGLKLSSASTVQKAGSARVAFGATYGDSARLAMSVLEV